MYMLYTIVDKVTGQELYAKFGNDDIAENEIAIEELRTEPMENPYFDFENRTFYDKQI